MAFSGVEAVVSTLGTAAMAIYTIGLYRINRGLGKINETLLSEQRRRQTSRDHAVRLSFRYRLHLAETALREGQKNSRFFMMWVQRTLDWSHPPADDLAGVFTESQIEAIIRAFLAMESFTNGVLMEIRAWEQWNPLQKLFIPAPSNQQIKKSALEMAEQTLIEIHKAQEACKFGTAPLYPDPGT